MVPYQHMRIHRRRKKKILEDYCGIVPHRSSVVSASTPDGRVRRSSTIDSMDDLEQEEGKAVDFYHACTLCVRPHLPDLSWRSKLLLDTGKRVWPLHIGTTNAETG